jgi:hypothetical protein
MDFLKYGREAQESLEKQSQSFSDNVWRFYLQKGQQAQIIFLDGVFVVEEGSKYFQDWPFLRVHTFIKRTPIKNVIPCLVGTEYDVCPLCEQDSYAEPVMVSSVIHMNHTSKEGVTAPVKKIWYMPKSVIAELTLEAEEDGGVQYKKCIVQRTKDKKSQYKTGRFKVVNMEDLQEELGTEFDMSPFEYKEVIKLYTAQDMYRMRILERPIGDNSHIANISAFDFEDGLPADAEFEDVPF